MNLKKYAVINEHSRLISLTVEDVDNSYLKTLHQSQVNFSKKEVSKEETKKKKKGGPKFFLIQFVVSVPFLVPLISCK